MASADLGSLLLGAVVIAGQTVGFAISRRPTSPLLRVLLVLAVVVLFLAMPLWWAVVCGIALTLAVLLLEPTLVNRATLERILAFTLGLVAMIPVVYVTLWTAQHTVGRIAIPPALFGSAFAAFALLLAWLKAVRPRASVQPVGWALLGASACLFLGGILSIVFWDVFAT